MLSLSEFEKMMSEGGVSLRPSTIQDIFRQIKHIKKPEIAFSDLI